MAMYTLQILYQLHVNAAVNRLYCFISLTGLISSKYLT